MSEGNNNHRDNSVAKGTKASEQVPLKEDKLLGGTKGTDAVPATIINGVIDGFKRSVEGTHTTVQSVVVKKELVEQVLGVESIENSTQEDWSIPDTSGNSSEWMEDDEYSDSSDKIQSITSLSNMEMKSFQRINENLIW